MKIIIKICLIKYIFKFRKSLPKLKPQLALAVGFKEKICCPGSFTSEAHALQRRRHTPGPTNTSSDEEHGENGSGVWEGTVHPLLPFTLVFNKTQLVSSFWEGCCIRCIFKKMQNKLQPLSRKVITRRKTVSCLFQLKKTWNNAHGWEQGLQELLFKKWIYQLPAGHNRAALILQNVEFCLKCFCYWC